MRRIFATTENFLARHWLQLERQRGQGMAEYGLIIILIAIVVVFILAIFGHKVSTVYSNIDTAIP